MASQVQICNLALVDIGAKTINALDDGSVEADVCDEVYDLLLEMVLEAHTWDFAKKWVALAEDAGYTMIDEQYDYAYELPADYIRMSRMEDKDSLYEVRGSTLLTNVEDANIEYIQKITDPTKYPSHFVRAFSARMRLPLAMKVTNKGSKAIDFATLYYSADLPQAKSDDARQGNPSQETKIRHTNETDSWLSARGV